jgi:hypothetical protein
MMTYFLWFRDVFAVHPEFSASDALCDVLTPLFLANDPIDPIFTAFTLFAASGLFALGSQVLAGTCPQTGKALGETLA